MKVAVVAHAKKKLGGGLPELRTELRRRGHAEVVWREVMKSKKVPDAVRAAVAADPDLLLLWGGDGTVQRALDTMARKAMPDVPIAVLPAGTSNLFANNFDIPHDLHGAAGHGVLDSCVGCRPRLRGLAWMRGTGMGAARSAGGLRDEQS